MTTRPMAFQGSEEESRPAPAASSFTQRYICFSPFVYDLRRQALYREGTCVKLPTKVHEILLVLIEKSGEIVTREALRERLWPADVHVNFDANVNTTVNKLRQILGDSPDEPSFIETIPRQGYSFIAKVEFTDVPPLGSIRPKPLPGSPNVNGVETNGDTSTITAFRHSKWFSAGVVVLFTLGVLVGAAIVYWALRH
ncbi:MAG TPA: winged helix-turn-helix domain-containing protein [Dongiaceae bacterium]|nr:winged helix-turn-helix domain-containing protein [Dongiaceae bacterium]